MSSQWTNKYAIMRDLSLAQGSVPVDINGTLGAEDKPPALDIEEETEESYFGGCVADENMVKPDLGLIKSMLDMVRGDDEDDVEIMQNPTILQITKVNVFNKSLNPPEAGHCEKIPKTSIDQQQTPEMNTNVPKVFKHKPMKNEQQPNKKPSRNVAMASFFESIGVDQSPKLKVENKRENPVTLKTPSDFKLTNDSTKKQPKIDQEALKKVAQWLGHTNKETSNIQHSETPERAQKKANKKELLLIQPSTMFKRKSTSPKNPSPIPSTTSTANTELNNRRPLEKIETYKPSKLADEYFRMYTERSKMQAMLNEDVWARLERQMKEIDDRRKLELLKFEASLSEENKVSSQELSTSQTLEDEALDEKDTSTAEPSSSPPLKTFHDLLDVVSLPQHRHLLTGDCIVCEVLCGTERKSGARSISKISDSSIFLKSELLKLKASLSEEKETLTEGPSCSQTMEKFEACLSEENKTSPEEPSSS